MDQNHFQQCISHNFHSSYYLSAHGMTIEGSVIIPQNTQILFLTAMGGKLHVNDLRHLVNTVNSNPENRQAFFESLCAPDTRQVMSRALRLEYKDGPNIIQLTPYQDQIPEMLIDFWLMSRAELVDRKVLATDPAGFINFAQAGSADPIPIPISIFQELKTLPEELKGIWSSNGKSKILTPVVKEYMQHRIIPRMFQPEESYVNSRSNLLVNFFVQRCENLTAENLENQQKGLFNKDWESVNTEIKPHNVGQVLLTQFSSLVSMIEGIQLLAMGLCRGSFNNADANILTQRLSYENTASQSRMLEDSASVDQYCNSQRCSGPTASMSIPGLTYCQTIGCGVCNITGADNQLYCSTCPETQAVIIPGKAAPETGGQTCDICFTLDELENLALEWTTAWPNKEDAELEGTNIGNFVCTVPWQILYIVMALNAEEIFVELGDDLEGTMITPQMTIPFEAFYNASIKYLQNPREGYKEMVEESLNMIDVCIAPFVHIDPRLLHKILMEGVGKIFESINATYAFNNQNFPVYSYVYEQLNALAARTFATGATILEPIQKGPCKVDASSVNESRYLSENMTNLYNNIVETFPIN